MNRFNTFHIADPEEPIERAEFPHARRFGNRIANRRWLADRFAGSPYRDGDVDERQSRSVTVAGCVDVATGSCRAGSTKKNSEP